MKTEYKKMLFELYEMALDDNSLASQALLAKRRLHANEFLNEVYLNPSDKILHYEIPSDIFDPRAEMSIQDKVEYIVNGFFQKIPLAHKLRLIQLIGSPEFYDGLLKLKWHCNGASVIGCPPLRMKAVGSDDLFIMNSAVIDRITSIFDDS